MVAEDRLDRIEAILEKHAQAMADFDKRLVDSAEAFDRKLAKSNEVFDKRMTALTARMEALTARHEALSESVEMMAQSWLRRGTPLPQENR